MDGTILAIDCGTVLGWTCGPPGAEPEYGSHRVAAGGCAIGEFLDNYEQWLLRQVVDRRPHCLIFEAPIMTSGKTSIDTARKLLCLAGITEKVGYQRRVPMVREAANPTVCKFFTGRGRWASSDEKKRITVEVCRRLGWDPPDHNSADGLALWSFACSLLAPKVKLRRWEGALLGVGAA